MDRIGSPSQPNGPAINNLPAKARDEGRDYLFIIARRPGNRPFARRCAKSLKNLVAPFSRTEEKEKIICVSGDKAETNFVRFFCRCVFPALPQCFVVQHHHAHQKQRLHWRNPVRRTKSDRTVTVMVSSFYYFPTL